MGFYSVSYGVAQVFIAQGINCVNPVLILFIM